MKVVVVADGRSSITKSWLKGLDEIGYDIHLISTFPCEKPATVKDMTLLPIAFSSFAGSQVKIKSQSKRKGFIAQLAPRLRSLFLRFRHLFGPFTLRFYKHKYQDLINRIDPHVVHALRIPFEGMLASYTPPCYPLIVSTWGNDLTFHAHGSSAMANWTKRSLLRADAMMADTERDLDLSLEWGLNPSVPRLFVPGNGGLNLDYFKNRKSINKPDYFQGRKYNIINPRGFRPGSVHNDTFFKAIPLMLKEIPDVQFFCPAMIDQPKAEVRELNITEHVTLLPYLSQDELWDLYSFCDIYISLSSHDGTPNTFLEAIACNCFPIVGNIDSLREWVIEGESGNLVNPLDKEEVASKVIAALYDLDLRIKAQNANKRILRNRADRKMNQHKIADFYQQFTS